MGHIDETGDECTHYTFISCLWKVNARRETTKSIARCEWEKSARCQNA
jgi:hypothetical protein